MRDSYYGSFDNFNPFNLEDDSIYNTAKERSLIDSYNDYIDFSPVMPFTSKEAIIPSIEAVKKSSPIMVKIVEQRTANNYKVTYKNVTNTDNFQYPPQMLNKDIDIDLFDELAYHYKQRDWIKKESVNIIECSNPNNNNLQIGDVINLNTKIMKVDKYNYRNKKHLLIELNSLKKCHYKLHGSQFYILLPINLQNDIKNFNMGHLKPTLETIKEEENYSDNESENDINNNILNSSLIPIEKKKINIISNYIPKVLPEENICLITNNNCEIRIVEHNKYATKSDGIISMLINNLIFPEENKSKDIEIKSEKNHVTEDANGYCTIM